MSLRHGNRTNDPECDPPSTFKDLNETAKAHSLNMIIVFSAYIALTLVWWFVRRNQFVLRMRSLRLVCVSSLGVWMQVFLINYGNVVGRHHLPCDMMLVIGFTSISFTAAPVIVRTKMFSNRAEYYRLMLRQNSIGVQSPWLEKLTFWQTFRLLIQAGLASIRLARMPRELRSSSDSASSVGSQVATEVDMEACDSAHFPHEDNDNENDDDDDNNNNNNNNSNKDNADKNVDADEEEKEIHGLASAASTGKAKDNKDSKDEEKKPSSRASEFEASFIERLPLATAKNLGDSQTLEVGPSRSSDREERQRLRHRARALMAWLRTTSTFGLITLIMLLSFTLIWVVAELLSPHSNYGKGCVGCELEGNDAIAFAVIIAILALAGLFTITRVRHALDPLGIVRELQVVYLFGLVMVVGMVLHITDPGDLLKEGKVEWLWVVMAASLMVHTVQCPYQVMRTYVPVRIDPNVSEVTLDEVLSSKPGREAFVRYLASEFSTENWYFFDAVTRFKQRYERMTMSEVRQTALHITETYLDLGAAMEVNISDRCRMTVLRGLGSGRAVPHTIFDEAVAAVKVLMESDSFPRFKRSAIFLDYAHTRQPAFPASTAAVSQADDV